MKKIALLLLIVSCTSFKANYYATTWAAVAYNQTITQTAIKDAVNTGALYQSSAYTIPTSLRCITKADAVTYKLDSYYGTSLRSTNDVLTKEDFRVVRLDVTAGQVECLTHTSSYTVTAYADFDYLTLTAGTSKLYTNKGLTTTYTGSGAWVTITDGWWTYQVKVNSSGVITQVSAC